MRRIAIPRQKASLNLGEKICGIKGFVGIGAKASHFDSTFPTISGIEVVYSMISFYLLSGDFT